MINAKIPLISITIPAYNEAGNISKVVYSINCEFKKAGLGGQFEIIIVDDGSTDGTPAEIDQLAQEFLWVFAHHHERNQGIGAAYVTGFQASRGELTSFLPADGQIKATQVLNLLSLLGDADIVVSHREVYAWHRETFTFFYNLLTSMILGFNTNKQEGIYVIRTEILRELHKTSTTGLVHLEILKQCAQRKIQTHYGIMHVYPRISGQSKVANLKYIKKTFSEMFELRRKLISLEKKRGKSSRNF